MTMILQIIVGIAALGFFIWLCIPAGSYRIGDSHGGQLIDPNDSRQIAQLIGMTGGTIADAAIARYALQRFQSQYGRPATTLDVGLLVGMMQTMPSLHDVDDAS
jgi:hypothetical protein